MANIPIELQETPALQPTEVGIQARTQAAYRGRALFDQAAAAVSRTGTEIGSAVEAAGKTAVNFLDHQQINAGAAKGAELFSNLTQDWNQTASSADPHDPATAAAWREKQLEPALEQFQQGFYTEKSQEWASQFINRTRQHFYNKTESDMSSLAGVAVSDTVRELGNKFSNTAISDPSAVPAMLDQVDHSIGGIVGANPNLKGAAAGRVRLEVGQRIKEEIVKAGAYGAISNAADPEAAASAWIAKYPDYINGAEAHTFARAAKAQARSNLAAQKQATFYQKQLDSLGVEQARNKIWSDNVTVDPTGKPTINPQFFRDVSRLPAQYPNAPNATETAKTLLDWGERQQRPEKITTDPATASSLDDRMFAADNPTSAVDILKAEAAGKLSRQDGAIRIQLAHARDAEPIHDPVFKAALDSARGQIEVNMGQGQKIGTDKYAAFMQNFYSEYMKQRRAGTLPLNALDLTDPTSMISTALKPYRSPLALTISGNGGVGVGNLTGPGKTITGVSYENAPVVTSKQQYDALPSGTVIKGSDGKFYRKP